MKQFAKLINKDLVFFEQPSHILGNATEYANSLGYKEVTCAEGNGGVYEDGNYIIIETPAPTPPPVLTPEKQREDAYANELIIEWNGELISCDKARKDRMSVYLELGELDKYEVLKALWLDARNEIQNRYPG